MAEDAELPSHRLRRVLDRLGSGHEPTVGVLVDRLGADAPAMALLLLATAALVPGAAPVFAFAMLLVGVSLLLGRDSLRLPARLRARPMSARVVARATVRLEPIERRFARRGVRGDGRRPVAVRPIAALIVFDAVLVILPIPLGNGPPAFAAMLLALGLATDDRRAVFVGVVATIAALGFEIALADAGIALVRVLLRAV